MLGEIIYNEKIIKSNFGNIAHLPGSKMINAEDRLLGKTETEHMIIQRKDPSDFVIITEKVDGMNAGVYKHDDYLYPIVRKGYDARTNPMEWIQSFAYFVFNNENRFDSLLQNEERIVGEWMIKTHTLKYRLKGEPFIVYDIIRGNGSKQVHEPYNIFRAKIRPYRFIPAGLVHIGEAMLPSTAMDLLGDGYHGAVDGPEGVVYRYERADEFVCYGKYVAHPFVGSEEHFHADDPIYNHVSSKYKQYIPRDMREYMI